MTKEEIIYDIKIILEDPNIQNKTGKSKFYIDEDKDKTGTFRTKFKCETVQLLIDLSKKLLSKEEQELFWETIETPFIKPYPLLSPSNPKFKINLLVSKNIEYIFIFLVKAGRIDTALRCFDKKLIFSNKRLDILISIYFLLSYEPAYFDKNKLNLLGEIIEKFDSDVYRANKYFEYKAQYEIQKKYAGLTGKLIIQKDPTLPDTMNIDTTKELITKYADIIKAISVLIKQSRLNILKSELSGYNSEINQDKEQLKQKIKDFNFNPELNECLDRFDVEYEKGDKYNMKNGIGHIRSFIEKFSVTIAEQIIQKTNTQPSTKVTKMGAALQYFKDDNVKFLTENEEKCLYGIFSAASDGESGVHALASDREHARLIRNMAVEYGLFLVKHLEIFFIEKSLKNKGGKL